MFWIIDDTISNEANTNNFWQYIKSSKDISFLRLVPSEYKEKKIGNFGFFKKNMKEKLWNKVVEKLDEFLEK